jgi:hypothetical protein
MRTHDPRRARRVAMAAAGGLLALTATFAPSTAGTASAADDFLRLQADTTYRVDATHRVVHVRIDWDATNLQPNTVRRTSTGTITSRYYYDRILFAVPLEARSVRAASGGSALPTSVRARTRYREVTVRMPRLFYRGSRAIRVDFDLPSGKPRSNSDTRVGPAFTTFTAWAWGDDGRGTVRIILPRGFDDSGYGEDVRKHAFQDRVELTTGTIRKPLEWYWVVIADRPSALTDLRIRPADRPIVVHAWPEDTAWRDRVAAVLKDGLPVLEDLIGLQWPVTSDLEITEVHTPLLHGYAGFYDTATDDITMSEDLDEQTILHETSHAWFNGDLLRDRWLDEGLAEYFADRARTKLALTGGFAPTETESNAAGHFPLNAWPDPSRIDDDQTEAQETFGYAASYTVIKRIADEIGDDGMRAVLAAVDADQTAYVGDGAPETTGKTPDWKLFLDLVDEVGAAKEADGLFERWVVSPDDALLMRTRKAAREDYAALDGAGGEWAVPAGIRSQMSLWRFADAEKLIDAAEPVLGLRDDLAAASDELGVTTPGDLEAPFEAATKATDFVPITATLEDRIDATTAVASARDALAAPRAPLAELGLVGETPNSGYTAARSALSAGDVAGATAGVAATLAVLAAAESVGTTRAIVIGVVAAAVLLLLIALVVVLRRRRRRPAPGVASADASTTLAATPGPGDERTEVPPTIETAPGAEPD